MVLIVEVQLWIPTLGQQAVYALDLGVYLPLQTPEIPADKHSMDGAQYPRALCRSGRR